MQIKIIGFSQNSNFTYAYLFYESTIVKSEQFEKPCSKKKYKSAAKEIMLTSQVLSGDCAIRVGNFDLGYQTKLLKSTERWITYPEEPSIVSKILILKIY